MREHLDQTQAEATSRLMVATNDAIVAHIVGLADTLSDGLARQYPELVQ